MDNVIKKGNFIVTDVEAIGLPDEHGVTAYNVHVKGIEQQLFMRAKRAPEVGKEEAGEIKKETAKSGKQYYRFYREQKQFGGSPAVMDKLEAIHTDVKKLLDAKQTSLDDIVEVNVDEPINLSDIPF